MQGDGLGTTYKVIVQSESNSSLIKDIFLESFSYVISIFFLPFFFSSPLKLICPKLLGKNIAFLFALCLLTNILRFLPLFLNYFVLFLIILIYP